uniref:Uncharacterized protein n=1 Tax=Kalanchoe fedtschenkoi TaxID=63787 RepID=A0A7N0VFI5_KALFE
MDQFGAAKYEEAHPTHQMFVSDTLSKLPTTDGFPFEAVLPLPDNNFLDDNHQPNHQNFNAWASVDKSFDLYQGSYLDPFDTYALESHQTGLSCGMLDRPANKFYYDYNEDIKPLNYVVPDEFSCVTTNVDFTRYSADSNTAQESMIRVTSSVSSARKGPCKGKQSNVIKGQWTHEEDRLLVQLVDRYGIRKWSIIAQLLPGRIGKQCRERWHNHLRPNIKVEFSSIYTF